MSQLNQPQSYSSFLFKLMNGFNSIKSEKKPQSDRFNQVNINIHNDE